MKGYTVVFSEDAVLDLASSYHWGKENWGEEAARRWFADIRATIPKMLGKFPLAQPLAPDGDAYDVEVRQMLIGRYRVLFNVTNSTVTILHMRGPYAG
jgi:plasmid stabilization system protein ParE